MEDQRPASALPGYVIRERAAEASVHPTTFKRVLQGLPTKPMVRARVLRVLEAHGLSHLVPSSPRGAQ